MREGAAAVGAARRAIPATTVRGAAEGGWASYAEYQYCWSHGFHGGGSDDNGDD